MTVICAFLPGVSFGTHNTKPFPEGELMVDIPRPPPAPTAPVSFPFLTEDSEPSKGPQFCAVLCRSVLTPGSTSRGSVCCGHSIPKLLRNHRNFSGEQRPCREPASCSCWACLGFPWAGEGGEAQDSWPRCPSLCAVTEIRQPRDGHGTRTAPPSRATTGQAQAPDQAPDQAPERREAARGRQRGRGARWEL